MSKIAQLVDEETDDFTPLGVKVSDKLRLMMYKYLYGLLMKRVSPSQLLEAVLYAFWEARWDAEQHLVAKKLREEDRAHRKGKKKR